MHRIKETLRLLSHWFLSRRTVLLYFAAFLGILFLVYGLYGYPIGTAGYAALLGAAAGAIFAAIDFVRFSLRHYELDKLANRFPLGKFPAGGDLTARDYEAIILGLEWERLRLVAENERHRRDAEEYYSLWAHQIKTPISAMRLLLQRRGDESGDAGLELELYRIEQYVGMVLQYQRLESLNADLVFERLPVELLVKQAVKNLAPLFIAKGLPLTLSDLPGQVVTDSKWFVFVLEQVLTNALKYTREGGVSVFMDGKSLLITDTGIGIPGEDLPRVFERGFTGAAGRMDRRSTGIGLHLCREIVKRLGFAISIESTAGMGATVRIDLSQREIPGDV